MQQIISQSGTAHIINPTPHYSGHLAFTNRRQTFCEMHFTPEDSATPSNGVQCRCCLLHMLYEEWRAEQLRIGPKKVITSAYMTSNQKLEDCMISHPEYAGRTWPA